MSGALGYGGGDGFIRLSVAATEGVQSKSKRALLGADAIGEPTKENKEISAFWSGSAK